MTKEQLHDQVDAFFKSHQRSGWMRIALIHEMIEMEYLTSFECQWPTCLYDGRPFESNHRWDPLIPSIDHIVPQRENGPHRLENFRLVHLGCNSGWTGPGRSHTPDVKDRMSASAIKRFEEGRGVIYTKERADKISESKSGVVGGKPLLTITCPCGKVFKTRSVNRKYCNLAHYRQYIQRQRREIHCPCGKVLVVKLSSGKKKYCSCACANRFKVLRSVTCQDNESALAS